LFNRFEFQFRGPANYYTQQQPHYKQYTPYHPRWRQNGHSGGPKPQRDQIPSYEKAGPSNVRSQSNPASGAFKSWSELKAKDNVIETITLEPDNRMDQFSESHLIEPKDCKTYGACLFHQDFFSVTQFYLSGSVLRKLQIFGEGVVEKDSSNPRQLMIKYNVFAPSPNFRKSELPTPQYQVVITR
jgi:hypothetical protein